MLIVCMCLRAVCRLVIIAASTRHRTLACLAQSLAALTADVVLSEYTVEQFIVALLASSSAVVAVQLLASSGAPGFSAVAMDWLLKVR